ncbi:MAG: hypothetical protein JW837_04715 [Sedimentisphaerales bacterium]|nr:hypothetical protein [Sedimentisphaerales bacterium]
MTNDVSESKSLALRTSVLIFLSINLFISVIMWLNFLAARENFPSWFGPVFLTGVGLLICIICFYIWQLPCTLAFVKPPNGYQKALIWILIVLSVPCTSALHQFAPFRIDAIMNWFEIPARLNLIKYNFILTAGSLLVILILTVLYCLGRKTQAVTGLVILAGIMLVPNDNCGNTFNLPWMKWIGASPLMFMPNSVVLLIGYLGLHGIRPCISIILMAGINIGVFLLGLGHLTKLVW